MKNIEKIKLTINSTIKNALSVIDIGAVKFAIVVDNNMKLLGTLTDGDVRRALLDGKTLGDTIEKVYFKDPTVANINMSKEDIINICTYKKLCQVPIVDDFGKVVNVYILDELLKPKKHPNKVVLMVGGLGIRLKPLTETIPKPMLHVGCKPLLQTIVEKFADDGFNNIVMCVNYKSDVIRDYFGDGSRFGVNIEYIQEEQRMGTAGALGLLKEKPTEPFFVMNGDLLTNVNFEQFLGYHIENYSLATMCVREYDLQVPYGVVNVTDGKVTSIKEKPTHSFFVSAGIYILDPQCIDFIAQGEFYDMPTLFEKLISSNKNVIPFLLREYWLDIGEMDEYKKANSEYHKVF